MPRILLIDDSPSTLETVARILVGAGHQVRTCANGKQSHQMIEHEAFDLILTDIFMPEEDGLEVILKARRLRPKLPVVAMSGVTGALEMLTVAKQLGACQLLRKPFSDAELLAVVEQVLGPPSSCPAASQREASPAGNSGYHR